MIFGKDRVAQPDQAIKLRISLRQKAILILGGSYADTCGLWHVRCLT
jgi:hypothetical protein